MEKVLRRTSLARLPALAGRLVLSFFTSPPLWLSLSCRFAHVPPFFVGKCAAFKDGQQVAIEKLMLPRGKITISICTPTRVMARNSLLLEIS